MIGFLAKIDKINELLGKDPLNAPKANKIAAVKLFDSLNLVLDFHPQKTTSVKQPKVKKRGLRRVRPSRVFSYPTRLPLTQRFDRIPSSNADGIPLIKILTKTMKNIIIFVNKKKYIRIYRSRKKRYKVSDLPQDCLLVTLQFVPSRDKIKLWGEVMQGKGDESKNIRTAIKRLNVVFGDKKLIRDAGLLQFPSTNIDFSLWDQLQGFIMSSLFYINETDYLPVKKVTTEHIDGLIRAVIEKGAKIPKNFMLEHGMRVDMIAAAFKPRKNIAFHGTVLYRTRELDEMVPPAYELRNPMKIIDLMKRIQKATVGIRGWNQSEFIKIILRWYEIAGRVQGYIEFRTPSAEIPVLFWKIIHELSDKLKYREWDIDPYTIQMVYHWLSGKEQSFIKNSPPQTNRDFLSFFDDGIVLTKGLIEVQKKYIVPMLENDIFSVSPTRCYLEFDKTLTSISKKIKRVIESISKNPQKGIVALNREILELIIRFDISQFLFGEIVRLDISQFTSEESVNPKTSPLEILFWKLAIRFLDWRGLILALIYLYINAFNRNFDLEFKRREKIRELIKGLLKLVKFLLDRQYREGMGEEITRFNIPQPEHGEEVDDPDDPPFLGADSFQGWGKMGPSGWEPDD